MAASRLARCSADSADIDPPQQFVALRGAHGFEAFQRAGLAECCLTVACDRHVIPRNGAQGEFDGVPHADPREGAHSGMKEEPKAAASRDEIAPNLGVLESAVDADVTFFGVFREVGANFDGNLDVGIRALLPDLGDEAMKARPHLSILVLRPCEKTRFPDLVGKASSCRRRGNHLPNRAASPRDAVTQELCFAAKQTFSSGRGTSPLVLSRGEAKCMRGPSIRGTRRLTRVSVLEQ